MRLIDADAACEATHRETYLTESAQAAYRAFIRSQPTVDAVLVVRCKDCRHRGCALSKGYFDCNAYNLPRCRPDDFCSYGERVVKGES